MVRFPVLALGAVLLTACAGERPILLEGATAPSTTISVQLNPGDPVPPNPRGTSGRGGQTDAPTDTSLASFGGPVSTDAAVIVPASGAIEDLIDVPVTPPNDGIRGLITSTGVVLPVTGRAGDAFVVSTPCGNEALATWGHPLGPTQVVLDPGHGGDEPGAIGPNGLTEAELNLKVARRASLELAARGVSVVLTRNGDYRMPIIQRSLLADSLQAEAFVSIHHNTPAAAESDVPGTEVYVQSGSEPSRRLGGLLHEEITAGLDRFDVRWVARIDAGVLVVRNDDGEDAYGINRHSAATSALVEVAYLGNPMEARLMESDEYVDTAGMAVADAVERFLTTDDPGSGFVDAERRFQPGGDSDDATGGVDGCVDPALD